MDTVQYQFSNGSGIITIELPVSMKIRQSRQFLQGNSILGKGFTTFGSMNFEKALRIVVNNVTISNLEKGWGAVYYRGIDGDLEPTKSEDYNSFENSWRNI